MRKCYKLELIDCVKMAAIYLSAMCLADFIISYFFFYYDDKISTTASNFFLLKTGYIEPLVHSATFAIIYVGGGSVFNIDYIELIVPSIVFAVVFAVAHIGVVILFGIFR